MHLLLAWSHIPVEEGIWILRELSSRESSGIAVALCLQAGWNGCSNKQSYANAHANTCANTFCWYTCLASVNHRQLSKQALHGSLVYMIFNEVKKVARHTGLHDKHSVDSYMQLRLLAM